LDVIVFVFYLTSAFRHASQTLRHRWDFVPHRGEYYISCATFQVTFGDAVQAALAERKLLMAWFHQDRKNSQKGPKKWLRVVKIAVTTKCSHRFVFWPW